MVQIHTHARTQGAAPPLFADTALHQSRNFTIYLGKNKHKHGVPISNNRLMIQNIVYETLVEGIGSAPMDEDFKGVMTVGYRHDEQDHSIVFAMWFSAKNHLYFLTSLGQYAFETYQKQIEQFRSAHDSGLCIKLSLIHRAALENLQAKLAKSNLPKANICILQDTIQPA